MTQLPLTPTIAAIARRVIWFEPPEKAVAIPARFLAYVMTYGTFADVATLREYWSDEELREGLDRAPPGIFDPRSWAYWNIKLGRWPVPPSPERRFSH